MAEKPCRQSAAIVFQTYHRKVKRLPSERVLAFALVI